MLSRRVKSPFAVAFTTSLCAILGLSTMEIANAVTIDFTTFPGGTPIPDETVILDQFEPLGVTFQPLFPNSPIVKTDLGGILISGGPTAFVNDIRMNFVVPTTFVTVEIIGSGLNISAEMEAFNLSGTSLGTVSHTYTGTTGQLSPFTFIGPPGEAIASVRYNGGLNPSNSAASIGTLIFQPVSARVPDCSAAQAFPAVLWSPKHQFVPVVIMGVTDPDGDAVTITVTSVTQDEPVNVKGDGNTSPDAVIQAGAASVRAERSGKGNGRVYQVSFVAENGKDHSCAGAVKVGVPHSMQVGLTAIDDGQVYDSTVP